MKLDGQGDLALKRQELAKLTAQCLGVKYMPATEVAELPVE